MATRKTTTAAKAAKSAKSAKRVQAPKKVAKAKPVPAAKPAVKAKTTRAKPSQAAAAPRRAAKRRVAPVPKGFHTASPYLIVRGAKEALAFYARAFAARTVTCMAMPDGSVMHAELKIGDSMLMLTEENPEWGSKSPLTLGGNGTHVMLYVRDVDAFFARATDAGASVVMPPTDMFWGDRYGKLRDPFGHEWSIGTHLEDVGPKEMQRRIAEWTRQMAQATPATA